MATKRQHEAVFRLMELFHIMTVVVDIHEYMNVSKKNPGPSHHQLSPGLLQSPPNYFLTSTSIPLQVQMVVRVTLSNLS